MPALNIQLQGFPAANREARVKLVNQLTGVAIERKPFLDGSLLVHDLDPGNYEMEVTHSNLFQPVDKRVVRVFAQKFPTFVPVRVREDLFRDTPIRETVNEDLGPVQQAATDVRDRLAPIAGKSPGEAIRASDWNVLVGAVTDLANATLQLAGLVSPRGHDHPEIEEKVGEAQGNVRRFAEAFGRSLLELRREIETANLRRTVEEVIDMAPPRVQAAARERVGRRIVELQELVAADTPAFTGKLSAAGNFVLSEVNELAVAAGPAGDDFRKLPAVQTLVETARSYQEAGTQVRPEHELQTYLRTTRTTGGQLTNLVRR